MHEIATLHSPGGIPGIPGDYAPGTYLIDWSTRTATLLASDSPSDPESVLQPEEVQPDKTGLQAAQPLAEEQASE